MKNKALRPATLLLVVSLLANVVLIYACTTLLGKARSFYKDYRHFRALEIGVSVSTTLKTTAPLNNETRVVLFGDSRVENWIPLPSISSTTFINAGINGETTTEMRRRFEQDVLRHNPDIVVIQAGTNDLTASVTRGIKDPQALVTTMHSNMQYFINTLSDNNIQVVVTSIYPNNTVNSLRKLFWYNTLEKDITKSNTTLEKITVEAKANWLDLTSVFYDPAGNVISERYIDTLHVNADAYRQINQQLENMLSTIAASQ